MNERIDAHQHFWRYSREEYGWINDSMAAIAKDFSPEDLRVQMDASLIRGSVAVQARQSREETMWLLDLADRFDRVKGVVGWAPIASAEFRGALELLQQFEKLKGLRHVVQDEPDDTFLLRDDFNRGISLLKQYGLAYDILVFERQLSAAIPFVDRHPSQIFVLDHIGKPDIRNSKMEPWRSNIRELALRDHVYCKLSGMVTEANWQNWSPAQLQPYFEVVLEAFGPRRLMAGSDWPVCLVACSYTDWFLTVEKAIAGLSTTEQELILGGVAREVYSLGL